MGIISGIVNFVTGIAETVVSAISAAIITPTVSSIVGAVATVGLVVGGGILLFKGVKKLISIAENYVDSKHNAENVPLRFKPDTVDYYDNDIDCNYRHMSHDRSGSVARKVFSLCDSNKRSHRDDDDYDRIHDEYRELNNRRYCDRINGFYAPDNRFVPRNVVTINDDDDDDDVIDTRREWRRRHSIDTEYTDILDGLNTRNGARKEHAKNVLATLYGIGPGSNTTCLA
jgi:hypothetical protein